MSYVLAGLLQAVFWLLAMSMSLWLCRKIAPSLETAFFKVGAIEGMRMLIQRILRRRQGFQIEPLDPSALAPARSTRARY